MIGPAGHQHPLGLIFVVHLLERHFFLVESRLLIDGTDTTLLPSLVFEVDALRRKSAKTNRINACVECQRRSLWRLCAAMRAPKRRGRRKTPWQLKKRKMLRWPLFHLSRRAVERNFADAGAAEKKMTREMDENRINESC